MLEASVLPQEAVKSPIEMINDSNDIRTIMRVADANRETMIWEAAANKVLALVAQYENEILAQPTPELKGKKADELLTKVAILAESSLHANNLSRFIQRLNAAAGRSTLSEQVA